MEKYINHPRVVICNYCQKFGHIERICRGKKNNKHVCGKCASQEHETKECKIEPANYKCCHCNGKHESGNKNCSVVKQKLEVIKSRSHNG